MTGANVVLNQSRCKHCSEEIYETTVQSTGKNQWIHRYTGSAYCATRERGAMAEPEERDAAEAPTA